MIHPPQRPTRLSLRILLTLSALSLHGCAVVAVVDTVATVGVGTVGLVADAAIGTVRLTGKAVGATADALLPGASSP